MDQPKTDGVHGFQDSEAEHTPLNVAGHIEKRKQNRATWQEPHGSPALINTPVPAGGRTIYSYRPSESEGSEMMVSREGSRLYTGNETKGKVVVSGNHPNKKLSKLYG